jgi:hypothetical protein
MKSNFASAEAVGDFMFSPSRKHHFSWYLEPSYEYNFAEPRIIDWHHGRSIDFIP